MHKTGQEQKPNTENKILSDNNMGQKRVKVLDGMRAFAILFVLLSHSAISLKTPLVIKFGSSEFQNVFFNGWVGVDLFFVLSGFLITSQLLYKTLNMKNLKTYALRRFFRIAPTYYVTVLATLIVYYYAVPILGAHQQINLLDFVGTWAWPLLAHLIFLHDYLWREPSINGLFWSIPVEIKFYIALPVFLILLGKIKNPKGQIAAVAIFVILYVLGKYFLIYSVYGGSIVSFEIFFLNIRTPFHLALDGLLIGVLCAFILTNTYIAALKPHTFLMNVLFVCGLLLFFVNAMFPHLTELQADFFDQALMIPLFSLSFGFMLIALVRGCFARGFFENRFLRFIALISYSLYLSHLFVISFHAKIEDTISSFIPWPILCWVVVFLIFFLICIAVAYILHRVIERPFLNWSKKRFTYDP